MTQHKNRQQQFLFLLQHCFCKHFFHSVNTNFKLLIIKKIIQLLMMRAAKSLNNKKSIFNYEITAKVVKIN